MSFWACFLGVPHDPGAFVVFEKADFVVDSNRRLVNIANHAICVFGLVFSIDHVKKVVAAVFVNSRPLRF